ncbi:hypothetical protein [Marinobacter sp.]
MGGLSDKGTDILKEKAEHKLKEEQEKASPGIGGDSGKIRPGTHY